MNDRITLKDVYDIANRIEDKFDRKFGDLEDRTEKLESFQNKALGILAIVGTFSSLIASFIWSRVTMPK